MRKGLEYGAGFIVLAVVLIAGRIGLADNSMLFFRLLVGLSLGYALTRAMFGFAGSVNRGFRSGSTRLMRTLMIMFLGTAVVSAAFLIGQDATQYDLWVNQINLGLLAGGVLFGIGMAFSSCCASGVLTDVVAGTPRALITLLFFGIGVYVGFPVQQRQPWVKDTLISTSTFEKGVFLPDLFKWDGLGGYLGAILVTALLAGAVIWLSKKYEDSRKAEGRYTDVDTELLQEKTAKSEITYDTVYEKLFVKPWTLGMGAAVIGGIFILLMGVTKAGWGASTPYGFWFGRLLTLFGVPAQSVADFAGKPIEMFTGPFFKNGMNLQNTGIILGSLIALLLAGNFVKTFKEGLSINLKQAVIYAAGGFLMGFGTRLSNGCNVGALYTPIANFSLSGWIFLVVLVLGGIIGNIIFKKVMAKK